MSIKRLHFNLLKPYIDKPIDIDTLKKCIDQGANVAYCLYCIKNEVKEIMKFAELNDNEFDLMAHVRVKYALVGDAKRQAWSVKPFSSLTKIKPEYNFVCILDSKRLNKVLYYRKFKTNNPEVIYNLVEDTFQELQIITNHFE